jgi:hypothetical protein
MRVRCVCADRPLSCRAQAPLEIDGSGAYWSVSRLDAGLCVSARGRMAWESGKSRGGDSNCRGGPWSRRDAVRRFSACVAREIAAVRLSRAELRSPSAQLPTASRRGRLRDVCPAGGRDCTPATGKQRFEAGECMGVSAPARSPAGCCPVKRPAPPTYVTAHSSRCSAADSRARGSPWAMDTRTSGGNRGTP